MYGCFRFKKLFLTVVCIFTTLAAFGAVRGISYASTQGEVLQAQDGIFLPIIMYHSILKDPSRAGKFIVSPEMVESDMKYLHENGYTTVTVNDLIDYVYNDAELPDKPVMITLDDGYYNNVVYLLPLLEKYDMKAVISIVGSFTDKFSLPYDDVNSDMNNPSHNSAYSHLTWNDIAEINATGRVEIGNHTYNMHSSDGRQGARKKLGESLEEYDKVLREDLGKLQSMLTEKSGVTPKTFTYPFGFISRESIDILKSMGFFATLTCYEKPNYITKDPNCLFGLNRYNRSANGWNIKDIL